ncbi:TetR/AcrR family transcriptional regulator [Pseudonocardia spinosispora]|uniref:TetR/AcrR family transcriptional regulator n=1 Tax=Pseudonocardia spinosispora TaxID=103441 RepID=UPI00048AF4CD|nr:TetR family transcriptional regulator [Pseudonocardia spinosispora]
MNDEATEPPRRLSRAEAKARTRERLLASAAQVFARKGFAGASVEEIAEAAGYSIGALYSNFGNKEELFLELQSARVRERTARAHEIIERREEDDPITALGRFMVDIADKDTDFAQLQAEFWLYAVRNPHALDAMADRVAQQRDAMRGSVSAGMARRGITSDVPAETVTTVLFALFNGLVQQRRLDPDSVPPQLFGQAVHWLFTGLEEKK